MKRFRTIDKNLINEIERTGQYEYNGRIYECPGWVVTKFDDLVLGMLSSGLTTREIGKIFNTSHNNIWLIFETHRYDTKISKYVRNKTLLVRQVKKLLEEGLTEQEIALQLDVKFGTVMRIRKKLDNSRKREYPNITLRHKLLCRFVFGDEYQPGPQFSNFIKQEIEKLSPVRQQTLKNFYFKFINGITRSRRVYRHNAKKRLAELFENKNIDNLITQGVVIKCQK